MTIGILKEPYDRRVALVPTTLKKFKLPHTQFLIQEGAGVDASYSDEKYRKYAEVTDRESVLRNADILLTVNPIPKKELEKVKKGAMLVSVFSPFQNQDLISYIKDLGLKAASLDLIPRTTIAQTMDILSSMASIAGYRAVLLAAMELPGFFPMMITAAGSVKPCKVLVLGAGVAGLQAIATARRLGAIVEAFDVRAAAKEEVESLGAKFVEVPGAIDKRDAGGYAVEQTPEFMKRQQEEVEKCAASSDVVITTAQILGKKAPLLLTAETVNNMKAGSIVIDLAASSGGNCELSRPDTTVIHKGVKIIGNSNLPSEMPRDASFFFSNNAANYLKLLIKDGVLNIDLHNEIIEKTLLIKD